LFALNIVVRTRSYCDAAKRIVAWNACDYLGASQANWAALLGKPSAGRSDLTGRQRVYCRFELVGNALTEATASPVEVAAAVLLTRSCEAKNLGGFD
jgi:hypothetical protein